MEQWAEQARLLLDKAADDAFMMRELLKNPRSPKWGIGFQAQQAVEKAIKAVLCTRRVTYPFTHDLKLLPNLLKTAGVSPPPDEAGILDLVPHATALRYDAFPDEAVAGLEPDRMRRTADSVLEWAGRQVREAP